MAASIIGVTFVIQEDSGTIVEYESDQVSRLTVETVAGSMLHNNRYKLTVYLEDNANWAVDRIEMDEDEDDES